MNRLTQYIISKIGKLSMRSTWKHMHMIVSTGLIYAREALKAILKISKYEFPNLKKPRQRKINSC